MWSATVSTLISWSYAVKQDNEMPVIPGVTRNQNVLHQMFLMWMILEDSNIQKNKKMESVVIFR